jgi:Zn finger protein HypA/HybF involved in hydrogenase expression
MMSHSRLLDSTPSAIITVSGAEKKIYKNGQIFINDGDNFEIRLFNPLQTKIGVSITFNGINKNDGLLVLRPGEDITLDRFLGEKKKMKYETYTIDGNNSTAVKAVAQNGLVEFKFFKEKSYNEIYRGFTTVSTCNNNSSIYSKGSYTTTGSIDYQNIYYSDYVAENLDKNIDYTQYDADMAFNTQLSASMNTRSKKIETGRIESGPKSNQELKTVDVDFETSSFHTITYQLKPNSQKPVDIQEVRNYCSKCGYRIRKSSWLYCPSCGCQINE